MTKMVSCEGMEYFAMSADSYCAAALANVEMVLGDKGKKLPAKCRTPMTNG